MYINIVLVSFVILLGWLMSNKDNQYNRGLYIIFCSIVLILVAALRSPEWMTSRYHLDSLDYKHVFEDALAMNWDDLWKVMFQRYFGNEGSFDIGYLYLCKIIGLFTHSYYIFSILVDLLFFVPFGIILYRYGTSMRKLIFAFIFYIALIQTFLLAGARQVYAIGLDMMALLSVIDKKKWRALLCFLLGVIFHFSSFLFLIPLLMVWFDVQPKVLKLSHIVCVIMIPIVLAFPNQIILFLGETSGVEKYANYGKGMIQGGAFIFIFLIEILSLFCLIAIKKSDLQNSTYRFFYTMAPLFTLFAPLTISNGSMIRISLYYHLYLALLVPFAIDCMFQMKNRGIIYLFAILSLSVFVLQDGGIEYYFFWQK